MRILVTSVASALVSFAFSVNAAGATVPASMTLTATQNSVIVHAISTQVRTGAITLDAIKRSTVALTTDNSGNISVLFGAAAPGGTANRVTMSRSGGPQPAAVTLPGNFAVALYLAQRYAAIRHDPHLNTAVSVTVSSEELDKPVEQQHAIIVNYHSKQSNTNVPQIKDNRIQLHCSADGYVVDLATRIVRLAAPVC
jgi:hypothetical protein